MVFLFDFIQSSRVTSSLGGWRAEVLLYLAIWEGLTHTLGWGLTIKRSDYFALYVLVKGQDLYNKALLLFRCYGAIAGKLQCVIIGSQILISFVNMQSLQKIRGSDACKWEQELTSFFKKFKAKYNHRKAGVKESLTDSQSLVWIKVGPIMSVSLLSAVHLNSTRR